MSKAYSEAGVNVEAGYESVKLIKKHVESTYTKGVLGTLGGFGGMFEPDFGGMKRPVLVSGTDGVGTKVLLAFMADKHDTVGIDCVAMCVNDVLCCGAKPLFFLDYIACGKNVPERIESIVSGVAEGCRQANAALVGGETAEMAGMYSPDEYDLVGFCVGAVDYDKRIDGSAIVPGDVIVGLPSTGVHSNGFSLVRKLFPKPDRELLLELLTPTKIYVKDFFSLCERVTVKGAANITGGGFIENIPRMLPDGLIAEIYDNSARELDIFKRIQTTGNISRDDMYNTFNMGVGMAVCVSADEAEKTGYPVIGKITEGTGGIRLW